MPIHTVLLAEQVQCTEVDDADPAGCVQIVKRVDVKAEADHAESEEAVLVHAGFLQLLYDVMTVLGHGEDLGEDRSSPLQLLLWT